MNWYNWSSRCRQNQMKNLFIFVKKKKSKPKLTRYQHLRPPPGVASFPRSFSSSIFWPSLPPAPILNTIGAGCFAIFPGLICYSWASHLHCPCPRGGKWNQTQVLCGGWRDLRTWFMSFRILVKISTWVVASE